MNTQNIFIRFGKASFSMAIAVIIFFIKLLDSATDFDDEHEVNTREPYREQSTLHGVSYERMTSIDPMDIAIDPFNIYHEDDWKGK